jgi:RNA polymerase sigma-70 factor (ECF subfamily)
MSSRSPGIVALEALPDKSAIAPDKSRERLVQEVVALFDRFRNPLLRYLCSFGIGFHDGEEVIQEIYLSLFQHLERGKRRDNLCGWLFRVGRNLALKRRSRNSRDLELRAGVAIEYLATDPDPNPEDQLANNQTQERLLAVVQALRAQDRRCLYLRAEGLRYREIAQVLDMSVGAVSLSLSRSLTRIARAAER